MSVEELAELLEARGAPLCENEPRLRGARGFLARRELRGVCSLLLLMLLELRCLIRLLVRLRFQPLALRFEVLHLLFEALDH